MLGNFEWLEEQARAARVAVALGAGDGKRRRNVVQRCRECDIEVVTAVHRQCRRGAVLARIGAGTVVMAGAAIDPGQPHR